VQNRQKVEIASVTTPVEQALARGLLSVTDLLRLKAIARLHAWALPPDMSAADLLQEAILRVLQGSRRAPPGLSMPAFLAGVMRSIRTEQRRRAQREPGTGFAAAEAGDPAPDPERCLAARQELAAIYRLFKGDPVASLILDGLAAGLGPDEIRAANDLSKTEYDSTRKRIRRALLRAGLVWRQR